MPDDDRTFLFPDGAGTTAGAIVDGAGRELGRHRGLVHYTVGQRRGLGLAAAEPLYVLALDAAGNRLVVGPQADLAVDRLEADRFVAAVQGLPARGPGPDEDTVTVRIRHRHAGARVRSWSIDGERVIVELEETVGGAAPGQGLVLYAGDTVLGGGRLLAASRRKEAD